MEKSFDLGRLLKIHEKKHKVKPAQFVSVAGGVQRRLEKNLKYRKSSRLTVFDSIRNLPRCESPVPPAPAPSKEEHRRQQLEKWKEDKEKRKKEAAAHKKKPFVAGVPHAPLKFVPPPPPPNKPMPSISGRVTRSQSAKQQNLKTKVDNKQKVDAKPNRVQSFAPKNASFQPPKNLTKGPTLAPVNKIIKKDKINYVFNPVLPKTEKQVKPTKSISQITNKTTIHTRTTRNNVKDITDSKIIKVTTKPSPKGKRTAKTLQSSSSSEIDTASSTEKSPVFKVKTPRKSLNRVSKQFTPKNPIPKSESSSEERLRSPKSPVEVPMTPEQIIEEAKNISPCVTLSRGKDNARREMKKKMAEGLLDEDASNMDSVEHFRQQLKSEIERMTEMCEVWEKIQEQTTLTESVQEQVLAALGQARLLMAAKLQQFAGLVEKCARPRVGDALVTPGDLQGFWDMVYMQVVNIDLRFKKLEELRARNWVEEKPDYVQKKVAPKNNVKKTAKPATGPSRLREMIAAARKAKKEQEEPLPLEATADSKTFEAGFFCVRSPVRSPAQSGPVTPAGKPSLLKSVLSSEAKKSASKSTASFAMLRASILSRNVDEGIAPLPPSPLTPINLYATPARSILKSANVASEKKTGKKSIKVVLFDEDKDMERTMDNTTDNTIDNQDIEGLIEGVNKLTELNNTDSGMSSMDVEKEAEQKENKENSRRRGRLIRQDATTEDRAQVMTRSRRKSINTPLDSEDRPEKTPRRSSRKKKALQELEVTGNVVEDRLETPKRAVRSRKSAGLQVAA